ncbi:helix-turn-helix transcriptional regulator [methanotrophic endosymbiont of Bathymodiolus puteoserpentis (Logatchev)]|jgi:AraC-like DNA-binding protein|uniref:helix-turn-helix transcriptional regulator n=1 Tax=methanotrophic endosymbiont of Bathymodiolus puteoserpentis (Logatchev) TaxID=343235 RepID=UPI0013C89C7B|nr:helix-turn-helix transcriptional regulator [methanotrophic endosymbiont of Bathymodiolus puteoserpentis (Logatchev)]SHE23057.1 hypothetical protein BPUTEOMOX_2159 [methanotrophic endosymbiont of Bathymodiolus puteoserpentis (Logatchev)]
MTHQQNSLPTFTHTQEIPNHPIYLNRKAPKKLSAFSRVELNIDWILFYLRTGWTWSLVAELLEMSPSTLIRHFDNLVPEEEFKRPVAVMLPALKPRESDSE